jgi:DNA-binding SARP family transcriptional activator
MLVPVEFRLLGPLQVRSDCSEVPLPGERQRRILALLLLNPRRVVTLAEIVAVAWNEHPPATARRQVHTALWQLRRVLAQHGCADLLSSHAGGYRLAVEPEQVDVHRFEALIIRARGLAGAGRSADAVDELRAALALWTGPVLAGLGGAVLQREAVRLEELRLTALEDRFEHQLAQDCDDPALIAELTQLTDEYPLRERFAGALMLALHRAGRRAQALKLYHRISHALHEELGIEPGQQLSDRQAAILRQDAHLDSAPRSDAPGLGAGAPRAPRPRPGAVPAQLPRDIRGFVGRCRELRELDAVRSGSGGRAAATLSAACGIAGVGKTAIRQSTPEEIRRALAECMTASDIDDAMGWTAGTARRYRWEAPERGGLPPPDALLGGPVWFRVTFEAWRATHPASAPTIGGNRHRTR